MAKSLSLAESSLWLRVDPSKYPVGSLASQPSADRVIRSQLQAATFATTKASYLKCSVRLKPWTASVADLFYQTFIDAKVAQAHSRLLQVNSCVTLQLSACVAKTNLP